MKTYNEFSERKLLKYSQLDNQIKIVTNKKQFEIGTFYII